MSVFFHSWSSLGEVALRALCSYLIVVAMVRIIGEQALAKMSGYDLLVTISLGSVVASIPLSESIAVIDGLVAALVFLLIQEVLRFLQSRTRQGHKLVREKPRLVVWNGELLHDRLHDYRITDYEVFAAIRRQGIPSVERVQAVVLENDGDWSVVPRSEGSERGSAFEGLDVPD